MTCLQMRENIRSPSWVGLEWRRTCVPFELPQNARVEETDCRGSARIVVPLVTRVGEPVNTEDLAHPTSSDLGTDTLGLVKVDDTVPAPRVSGQLALCRTETHAM